jgi:hypothetical protein
VCENLGRKRKQIEDQNGQNIENTSPDPPDGSCGKLTLKGTKCKMKIQSGPCQFHDKPSYRQKQKKRKVELSKKKVEEKPSTPHVRCNCPLEYQNSLLSKKIYESGIEESLLPPFLQQWLIQDLAVPESQRTEHLKAKREERELYFKSRGVAATVKSIEEIFRLFGLVKKSEWKKEDMVHHLLDGYENEYLFRISQNFTFGSIKDWRCDTLVQLLNYQWREYSDAVAALHE